MRVQLPRLVPIGGELAGAGDQTLVFNPAAIVMMFVRVHGVNAP